MSYPELVRLKGLAIFDDVFPDLVPLALSLVSDDRRVVMIVERNFIDYPDADDSIETEFARWIEDSQTPVYRLKPYKRSSQE